MEQILDNRSPVQPSDSPPTPSEEDTGAPSRRSLFRDMAVFVGRRLLFGLAVVLAIVYMTHLAFFVANGNEFGQAISQATNQTLTYLSGIIQGDLGLSMPGSAARRPQPIMDILPMALGRSLGLLGVTFMLSIAIGVPLGILAATRRHGRGALMILVFSFVGISTPVFFAALFLQIAAVEYTKTFGQSIVPVGGFGWDKHLILPVLVLAARPIAQITRITFVSVSDALEQDYVRVAQGKGLRSYQILLVHVLRNAAIPILTTVVVSLRFVLSSLPVVELYFAWNGLGEILLRGLFNGDINLTVALLSCLGVLFILINLLLELSYYYIDPRIEPGSSQSTRMSDDSPIAVLKGIPVGIGEFLTNNPIRRWLDARRSPKEPSPFKPILERQGVTELGETPGSVKSTWTVIRYGVLGNAPLLLGGFIVGVLLLLMLFGPRLAPFSPNTTQQIAVIDGVLSVPPWAPSKTHIWGTDNFGRDIYSLIISGVQQTLVLAFGVVIVRMSIGFVLGVLAGWFHDSWLDRLIMGMVQALAVFPTLLLAALLIFAIGFEGGMTTFFIALFLVGWGEIVEYVRSEVITIRPKPFIESAVAVGQSTTRLIRVHFLPNLAPGLIAVAAVEVSAVLLILGELGFIGIFIRGGAATDFGLYAQVPEWGSLLSGVRGWVRSYPWTGFYPTAAFFVAILGFNLFGEGLRRLLGRISLVVNKIFSRYSLVLVALLVAGFFWFRGNTGEIVFYRQQADVFNGQNAIEHIEVLTDPAMEGRALGSAGLSSAAEYIAEVFSDLGLQPAGERITYFQDDSRTYHLLDSQPLITVDDSGPEPTYRQDYNVYPKGTLNLGQAQGRVRFLALGEDASPDDLELSNDVVLILAEQDLEQLQSASCRGVLVIAENVSVMKQRYTLSSQPVTEGCGQETPVLWIHDRFANRLLIQTGENVASMEDKADDLDEDEILDLPLTFSVSFNIPGTVHNDEPVVNVIGHLPGTAEDLDGNLIIVATQYDSPPIAPDGLYPGANDSASGVAVMMESVRTLLESGYQPFKTFLFVAYSGEGLPDLAAAPDVNHFLQARTGFDSAYEIEAVIYLRGLGAGGDSLVVWSEGQTRLSKLLETSSNLKGADTERYSGTPTMNAFLAGGVRSEASVPFPQIGLGRQGWESASRLPNDSLTFITTENLQTAGESLSLGLMILGRERTY